MYNPNNKNVNLDHDYLPSLHAINPDKVVENFVRTVTLQTSELTTKLGIKVQSNLRYGGVDDRRLVDVYYDDNANRSNKPAPLFVFIHGGYWQLMDKSSSGSMVEPLVRRGYRVAVMDYNLCPQVALAQIVEQVSEFLQWIFKYAAKTHTTHISFAGHSAGAHLLAQLFHDPTVVTVEQQQLVSTIFFISGVYDLRELWNLPSVNPNDVLGLNEELATQLSPMLWKYVDPSKWPTFTKLHVLVTAHDSITFIEQSRAFAQVLKDAGYRAKFHIFPEYDHFTIIENSAIDGTAITNYMQEAMNITI